MPMKVVLGFGGPTGDFWTEIYHTAGGQPYATVQAFASIAQYRTAFMSSQCTLLYIQASDMATPKASYRAYLTRAGAMVAAGAVNGIGSTDDTLVYKFFNAQSQYIFKFFRGAPSNQFQRDPLGNEIAPTKDADIKTWFTQLVNLAAGWLQVTPVDRRPGQQFSWNSIESVDGQTFPGYALLTLQVNPILSASSQVYISKTDAKLLPGINGIWNAIAGPLPNQIKIKYQVANNAVVTNPNGRLRIYQTTFTPFANPPAPPATFDNLSSHKTRDFFTRGRRAQSAKGLRTLV
jgi:hypothetical protein